MHELSREGGVEELGEGPFMTKMGPSSRIVGEVAGDGLFLDILEVALPI